MDRVRTAVVGVGSMGQNHARIYSSMPGVHLVGIVDTDKEKAVKISKMYGIECYSDYRELFGKVDAVNIAVPTTQHHRVASDFIEHGVHVLIEKPITASVREAQELVDAARKNGRVLQVGHLERFNPAVIMIREKIRNPIYLESRRLSPKTTRNLDVGVVWDLMIHDLDIIVSMVKSPIMQLKSFGQGVYSNFEDLAMVVIAFENGCVASLAASRIGGERLRRFKVIEEDRTFSMNFIDQTLKLHIPQQGKEPAKTEWLQVEKDETLRLELEHFVECVTEHKTPAVTGEDGKRALELATEVVRKMEMVSFPQVVS